MLLLLYVPAPAINILGHASRQHITLRDDILAVGSAFALVIAQVAAVTIQRQPERRESLFLSALAQKLLGRTSVSGGSLKQTSQGDDGLG
jgi:hypothetical protein